MLNRARHTQGATIWLSRHTKHPPFALPMGQHTNVLCSPTTTQLIANVLSSARDVKVVLWGCSSHDAPMVTNFKSAGLDMEEVLAHTCDHKP